MREGLLLYRRKVQGKHERRLVSQIFNGGEAMENVKAEQETGGVIGDEIVT